MLLRHRVEILCGFLLYAWAKLARKGFEIYSRCFASRAGVPRVRIVLADWGAYPLMRVKRFGGGKIRCGLGRILGKIARREAGAGFRVLLVINDCPEEKKPFYQALKWTYGFIETVIFRDNTGADFGAYNAGYLCLKNSGYEGDVVFMNSGAAGPDDSFWLRRYHDLFHHRNDLGLCGVSMNSSASHIRPAEWSPHIQSFFLYTSMRVLDQVCPEALPGCGLDPGDKARRISEAEIGLSRAVLEAGLGLCCGFFGKKVYFRDGPWRYPRGDLRHRRWYRYFINRL